MPDSPNRSDSSAPTGESHGWSRAEIDAAIAGLDRATKKFTSQVEAIAGSGSPEPLGATPAAPASPAAPSPAAPSPLAAPFGASGPDFDARMTAAEREARDYLERAKRRADSLVTTMIGAVEKEAAQIKQDAEQGIRERWRAVEAEAGRYLDDCRRVADGMVAERRSTIGELSDGIVERAHSLTNGLDDAERVRAQFEAFVRALAATSNQIAEEASGRAESDVTRLRNRPEASRRGALAA